MMFFQKPSSSPAYRAAAWGVAILGVVAWTYWEQNEETATTFSNEEAAKWNERVKGKTKSRGVLPPTGSIPPAK